MYKIRAAIKRNSLKQLMQGIYKIYIYIYIRIYKYVFIFIWVYV